MTFSSDNFVGGKAFMVVSAKEVERIRKELKIRKPRKPLGQKRKWTDRKVPDPLTIGPGGFLIEKDVKNA